MNVSQMNALLLQGEIDHEGLWPRITEYEAKAAAFRFEFGLDKLPTEPGLIVVRGARQYGKSTWLDLSLRDSIATFGKGSGFYLNGDDITNADDLELRLLEVEALFAKSAGVRRIFVDEITAVEGWEKAFKRLWDRGHLRNVLVVTTGSKAADLRHGSERLPGRKGKLGRTDYLFLPVSFSQFNKIAHAKFGEKTWIAYLLTGGSPVLCNDIYENGCLSESSIQLIRDWILGDLVSSGRNRVFALNIMQSLFRFGGSPVGYAKLARESGLANNTVAAGYIERLSDLLSILPAWQWDSGRKLLMAQKPCKFNFINLAVAVAFHPNALRMNDDFQGLEPGQRGAWTEWLVAQEIFRRTALSGHDPERTGFWKSKEHEIDFVTAEGHLIEVKSGTAGPLDFGWFRKVFPKDQLTVVCKTPFETDHVRGITAEEFLLKGWS